MGAASRSALEAVVFDMDGVLVDSERPSLALLQRLLAEAGIDRSVDDLRHVCGRPAPYMRRLLLDTLAGGEAAVNAFLERYAAGKLAQLEAGEVLVFAGVHELLADLERRGLRRAVATSTQADLAMRRLRRFGLAEAFDTIVTGDQVARGKPAPDIFLRAAERLGVAPERCLVVEDSVVGVRAGRSAGMRVVALSTTFPAEALREADIVVSDAAALRARLDAVLRPAAPGAAPSP